MMVIHLSICTLEHLNNLRTKIYPLTDRYCLDILSQILSFVIRRFQQNNRLIGRKSGMLLMSKNARARRMYL